MDLGEPVTTIRPGIGTRVVLPAAIVGLGVVFFLVAVFMRGADDRAPKPPGEGDGSLVPAALVCAAAVAWAGFVGFRGRRAKVEIAVDRIRVSGIRTFQEAPSSSVIGIRRYNGKYEPQRLVLRKRTRVVVGSLLGSQSDLSWVESDLLTLPGVRISEMTEALVAAGVVVEEDPRLPIGSMLWHDGKPGWYLYALLIAIVVMGACIIWGTTGGTGPIANPGGG